MCICVCVCSYITDISWRFCLLTLCMFLLIKKISNHLIMYNFPMLLKNASPTPRWICSLIYLSILKDSWFIMCFVVVVQSINYVQLFVTPWTVAHQASLSFTISRSLLKLMSVVLMMPSNHLILCHPLLLLPLIFTSIKVFSNESALCIRWPKHWSFSFNISPSNE